MNSFNSIREAIFVLCLGLASLSSAKDEFCSYNVTKCYCTLGSVNCYGLDAMPPITSGSNVMSATTLEIYAGNIVAVDSHNLLPGLVKLKFISNPLTNISDDAFDNSATTLNELSIVTLGVRKLPRALLSLTNLTSLIIINTHIDVWDNDILQRIAKTLTYLELEIVGLREWPTWFSYFQSLTTADLSLNSFPSIPNDAFKSISNTLQTLKLEQCNFTHIPEALSTLTNLTLLVISGNNISDTNDNSQLDELQSFPLAGTLNILFLEAMGLTRIPDLSNMTRLQAIYLGYNHISNTNSIRFPPSVEILHLEYNKFTSVPAGLSHLSNLTSLTMFSSQITELNFDMLPSDLNYLDLNRNEIIKITNATSTHQSSLQTLILHDNPIKEINPLAFKNLVYLKKLDLQTTNLTQLPLALSSLERLSFLLMRDIPFVSCSDPPPSALAEWFHSYSITIEGICYDKLFYGIPIQKFLASWSPTTPATTPAKRSSSSQGAQALTTEQPQSVTTDRTQSVTTQGSTTTTGGAALCEACWCCRYVCLLLLIPTCIYYI